MKARMGFRKASPPGEKAMAALHAYVHKCGLEQTLLELVKLRASQINGANRLNIAFRMNPGSYRPRARQAAE